jgi:Icc-related predicted phosphoesterase
MTVKELIDRLSKCNPDQIVVLEYVDHTDWVYRMEFSEDEITDDVEMFIGYDNNDEEIIEKVVLIECKEENDIQDND